MIKSPHKDETLAFPVSTPVDIHTKVKLIQDHTMDSDLVCPLFISFFNVEPGVDEFNPAGWWVSHV